MGHTRGDSSALSAGSSPPGTAENRTAGRLGTRTTKCRPWMHPRGMQGAGCNMTAGMGRERMSISRTMNACRSEWDTRDSAGLMVRAKSAAGCTCDGATRVGQTLE